MRRSFPFEGRVPARKARRLSETGRDDSCEKSGEAREDPRRTLAAFGNGDDDACGMNEARHASRSVRLEVRGGMTRVPLPFTRGNSESAGDSAGPAFSTFLNQPGSKALRKQDLRQPSHLSGPQDEGRNAYN